VTRIPGQFLRVVRVRVTQRDPEDPLPEKLQLRVRHLSRLPRVARALRHYLRESKPLIGDPQRTMPFSTKRTADGSGETW
jgi:hypothetical protein